MSVARKNAVPDGEADSALQNLMKAVVQDRFGPPETLQLVDAERPEIGSGEVLLQVHAASVNPWDWHMLRGDPRIARLIGGVGLMVESLKWLLIIALVLFVASFFTGYRGRRVA